MCWLRRYISTLPVPAPPSQALSNSTRTLSVAPAVSAVQDPTMQAFVPNPLYAALLQKIDAAHPAAAPLGVPIKSLPVPVTQDRGEPVHRYLAQSTLEEEQNLGLMRRDLSEVAAEAGVTYAVPTLRAPSASPGQLRRAQSSSSRAGRAGLGRSMDSGVSQRFLQGSDKFAALMEKRRTPSAMSGVHSGVERITPLLPPYVASLPAGGHSSSSSGAYEQRLQEVMRSGSGLMSQRPASFLSRSASSLGGANYVTGPAANVARGTGGVSSYRGGAPSWAQFKYE
jgi:hypothetical protein